MAVTHQAPCTSREIRGLELYGEHSHSTHWVMYCCPKFPVRHDESMLHLCRTVLCSIRFVADRYMIIYFHGGLLLATPSVSSSWKKLQNFRTPRQPGFLPQVTEGGLDLLDFNLKARHLAQSSLGWFFTAGGMNVPLKEPVSVCWLWRGPRQPFRFIPNI